MEWFQGPISDLDQAAEEERRALDRAFQEGQDLLKGACDICQSILKDQPVRIETVVATGDPAQQIMENAEKKDCDLIILGSRGMGPVRGVILGSVSQKVLNNTQRPVLIVK
jgi:nucleotide-binding universal stress UspA family protein